MAKGTGQGAGRGSAKDLKVRVKTAKGRKIGSTLWLQRQLNDPYGGIPLIKLSAARRRLRTVWRQNPTPTAVHRESGWTLGSKS